MLCLLLSQTEKIADVLKSFCERRNWALVVYRLPLKALDNMTEVSPEAVIINAVDFPRQWKIVVQHINAEKNKNTKKVLLVGENFSATDAKKAEFLRVDLILKIDDAGKIFQQDKLTLLNKQDTGLGLLKIAETLF